MGKVIVVTSGKGGVGKTTTTANLGVRLAINGYKTLMIDTDIGLRNLDVVMGLERRIVYNLVDVINGICRVNQALIRDKRYHKLYLLPAAVSCDKTSINREQMKKLLDIVSKDFDYILIDCPAGIESGFDNAVFGADMALIITTPDISAIKDADRVNALLDDYHIKEKYLIVNRIRYDMVKRKEMLSAMDVKTVLGLELIGIIYDNKDFIIAADSGCPVADQRSVCKIYFDNIARRITGEKVEFSGRGKRMVRKWESYKRSENSSNRRIITGEDTIIL